MKLMRRGEFAGPFFLAKRWMAKNGNAVPFQRNPATPPPAEKCGGHRRAATAVLLVVAAKTSIMEIVRDKRMVPFRTQSPRPWRA